METTLDTNVILDVLLADPAYAEASERAIDDAGRVGALSIGPVTFAELTTVFARKYETESAGAKLTRFLSDAGIATSHWQAGAAETAGVAYAKHLRERDPRAVECGSCGERTRHKCPSCRRIVAWRAHIMTDFLIGAHALHATGRILTRDPHLHAKIPGLEIVAP